MVETYRVELTYFKTSGKYYTSGSFPVFKEPISEIRERVKTMIRKGKLPGLREGAGSIYLVLVSVPDHPYNVPAILNIQAIKNELAQTIQEQLGKALDL